MANNCYYEVHVKGTKKAAQMIYAAMPVYDDKEISSERGSDSNYEMVFTGNCKWSVNYGVTDKWDKGKIDLSNMSEDEIRDAGLNYWDYSLRVKSEVFQCEIQVHYWSGESEFDQFDQYKNGKCLKSRSIPYDHSNYSYSGASDPSERKKGRFNWKTLEFNGFEGECSNYGKAEAEDAAFMAKLLSFGSVPSAPEDGDDSEEDDEEFLGKLSELDRKISELEDAVKKDIK